MAQAAVNLLFCALLTAGAASDGNVGVVASFGEHKNRPAEKAAAAVAQAGRAGGPASRCKGANPQCLGETAEACDPSEALSSAAACVYVQANRLCQEDSHRLDYLRFAFCSSPTMAITLAVLAAWLLLLFFVLKCVAEEFLVPAVQYLAARLKLPPDIAGVTLFAFAAGAPDFFTQLAALAVGQHTDVELAVAATFGSNLFITAVVFAVVVLSTTAPEQTEVPDRRAFLRDVGAYLLACLLVLALLARGRFAAGEAWLMVGAYCVYLVVCVVSSRGNQAGASSTQQQQQQQGQQEGSTAAAEQQPLVLGWPVLGAGGGLMGGQRDDVRSFSPPRDSDPTAGRVNIELVPRPAGGGGSTAVSRKPTGSGVGAGHVQDLSASAPPSGRVSPLALPPPRQLKASASDLEAAGVMPAAALQPAAAAVNGEASSSGYMPHSSSSNDGWPPWVCRLQNSPLGRALSPTAAALARLLHLQGKRGWQLALASAAAPAMLLLHATMPSLDRGRYSVHYAAVLGLAGPPFFLLCTGATPAAMGAAAFFIIWAAAGSLLLVLATALVSPLSTPNATADSGSSDSAATHTAGAPLGLGLSSPCTSPRPAPGSRWGHVQGLWRANAPHRPRHNALFALLAVVQSVLWMALAADEVVALFQAVGRMLGAPQDLLGATVLAWGETLPDLIAVLAVARAGQATMAVASCFGGPVFNLLISLGVPMGLAALQHGPLEYHMSPGMLLLILSSLLVLSFLLLAVPFYWHWRLDRNAGIALLLLYTFNQLMFMLVEAPVVVHHRV